MRLVFLGTPSFAVPALDRILDSGHEVLAVVTQPDRRSGRSQTLSFSPVKQTAVKASLPIYQPERIRRQEAVDYLAGLHADAMIVVGYGQIIPQSIIDLPQYGIINVHASLLPKYRGAAPVQWAIVNGETRTGVTTMRIDAGLDTGDILLQSETGIGAEETSIELAARLAVLGADLLAETLTGLETGAIVPRKQDSSIATLAPILKKEDGSIDWNRTAAQIHNRVRGLLPWPGTHSRFREQNVQIWKTRVSEPVAAISAGQLRRVGRQLYIGCGDGLPLELLELQLEGKKRITAEAFANGQRLNENDRFGDLS